MVLLRHPLSYAALLASLLVACEEVVVDEGASGGGGAAATSTSSTGPGSTGSTGSTGGTGGAGGCQGLESDFLAKLESAQACKPEFNGTQCSGTVTAVDLCGCPVVASDMSAAAATVAVTAYDAWVKGGCGPIECLTCPPPPTDPWYCDDTDAVCKPLFIK